MNISPELKQRLLDILEKEIDFYYVINTPDYNAELRDFSVEEKDQDSVVGLIVDAVIGDLGCQGKMDLLPLIEKAQRTESAEKELGIKDQLIDSDIKSFKGLEILINEFRKDVSEKESEVKRLTEAYNETERLGKVMAGMYHEASTDAYNLQERLAKAQEWYKQQMYSVRIDLESLRLILFEKALGSTSSPATCKETIK